MKYCKQCKIRGKDSDASCARCGKPFRQIGLKENPQRRQPAPHHAPANDTVRHSKEERSSAKLDLAGLQHRVSESARRVRRLASLAALILFLFASMLLYLRYSYVMQFAEVADLVVRRSEFQPESVSIAYRPMTEGRIEFMRTSDNRVETLVDHAPIAHLEGDAREFRWSNADQGKVTVEVRYRQGWSVTTKTSTVMDTSLQSASI